MVFPFFDSRSYCVTVTLCTYLSANMSQENCRIKVLVRQLDEVLSEFLFKNKDKHSTK